MASAIGSRIAGRVRQVGPAAATAAHVGVHATLLQAGEVGERSIISAGALVTQSVPATSVAVGLPAWVVRTHASLLLGAALEQPACQTADGPVDRNAPGGPLVHW